MISLQSQGRDAALADTKVEQARELSNALERAMEAEEPVCLSLMSAELDTEVELPSSLVALLAQALRLMAAGKRASLVPIDAELTTRQAADMLNVSRTYLIKLLDTGRIPYHRIGRHRRIRREDILRHKETLRRQRREALDQLAAESQEYRIGYD